MLTRLLHFAVYGAQAVRRSIGGYSRSESVGVHGIPLTPDGKVVLVTLRYAFGWRLPGGGKKRGEGSHSAILRELREEIGLLEFESIKPVCSDPGQRDSQAPEAALFVVRGVRYRTRRSLEVKEVGEFDLAALPLQTATITRSVLAFARPNLP